MPSVPGVPTGRGCSSKELSVGRSAGFGRLGPAQELCMIPFSILDLAPIAEGSTATDAFRNSLELAQHAEQWGFRRFWVGEHCHLPGLAPAATSCTRCHLTRGAK